jgi:hypothetical protein
MYFSLLGLSITRLGIDQGKIRRPDFRDSPAYVTRRCNRKAMRSLLAHAAHPIMTASKPPPEDGSLEFLAYFGPNLSPVESSLRVK